MAVGETVGVAEGVTEGAALGEAVGVTVGAALGEAVGVTVGAALGAAEGATVGARDGDTVGINVGEYVDTNVTPDTAAPGLYFDEVVPSPACPFPLLPQQYANPVVAIAQEL